jgi:hypothetical protein
LLGALDAVGFTLGGLVAGEGSFMITERRRRFADGSACLRFRFQVTLASRDRSLLEALRGFLGVGSIRDVAPQKATWQPTSVYEVASLRSATGVITPFADRYLLPSAKRVQFESWRQQLVTYVATHPEVNRARSTCTVAGCDKFVRGRGLCRSHYYQATGY